jgi:hypothetical protein
MPRGHTEPLAYSINLPAIRRLSPLAVVRSSRTGPTSGLPDDTGTMRFLDAWAFYGRGCGPPARAIQISGSASPFRSSMISLRRRAKALAVQDASSLSRGVSGGRLWRPHARDSSSRVAGGNAVRSRAYASKVVRSRDRRRRAGQNLRRRVTASPVCALRGRVPGGHDDPPQSGGAGQRRGNASARIREYQAALFTKYKLAPATVIQRLAALRFSYVQTLRRRWSVAETPYSQKARSLPTILS